MILKDNLVNLILKMDVLITKKGKDIGVNREVISAINSIVNSPDNRDSIICDTIFINEVDNFNIPDVLILPLYNNAFNMYLMDGDLSGNCPFGYTIEIHKRCFDKYNAEEITACIIHDILQNVCSCTAKTRFIKAYNDTLNKYNNDQILKMFDDISNSEICFIAFADICSRPFKVPVLKNDYIGTDEVLISMGLGDAYESYLNKVYEVTNLTPEDRILAETKEDYNVINTIFKACVNNDIRHYVNSIKVAAPLVSFDNILNSSSSVASIGFVSKDRYYKKTYHPKDNSSINTITESFINPKNEIDIRFQIDKIISNIRYAETEPERQVILIKIKNLTIKLTKVKNSLEKAVEKNSADKVSRSKLEYVNDRLAELEILREKTVTMEIKQKKYGLFIAYPEGYQY